RGQFRDWFGELVPPVLPALPECRVLLPDQPLGLLWRNQPAAHAGDPFGPNPASPTLARDPLPGATERAGQLDRGPPGAIPGPAVVAVAPGDDRAFSP